MNRAFHGKELVVKPLWQKGPYVPEELVLVKGPVKEGDVEVLVLAKVEAQVEDDLYRRVGVGYLKSWDEGVEHVETLKII